MPYETYASTYCVTLRPVTFFVPSEEVDETHVRSLMHMIADEGVWTEPIPIEQATGIVMDGNHRTQAALRLGLRFLPCVPLDYGDTRVSVTHWDTGEPFSVERIRTRLLDRQVLFPYKTTRHRFAPELPRIEIPLAVLSGEGAVLAEASHSTAG